MSIAPGEVKPGQPLAGMAPALLGAIVMHPAQQAIFERILKLIGWLRACDEPSDYDQFQRHLFGDIHQTEERRYKCNQAIKRLRSHKAVPADAIDLFGVADPTNVAAWQFELFMHERLARQLRCVGDALAWRCYRYDRPAIIALSRNDSPGPMYNKAGLPYELGRVEEIWKDDGHFALLHDLTNCLRIADLSEIVPGGMTWLREIKAKPHTDSRQMARAQAAIDATFSDGPIPESDARFVQLDTPFRTSISSLRDCIQLAKQRGAQGMKLSQGRARDYIARRGPTTMV
ncbi:MAG: hypothetical protein QG597_4586 [Actinomycetota bacterium]|nr:hypothetical protein [Actinomycetota bacterium]